MKCVRFCVCVYVYDLLSSLAMLTPRAPLKGLAGSRQNIVYTISRGHFQWGTATAYLLVSEFFFSPPTPLKLVLATVWF